MLCAAAAEWLAACGETYIVRGGCDDDEAALIRDEVVPRYVAWFDYLVSVRDTASRPWSGRPIDVITTEDADVAVWAFGADAQLAIHRFDTGGTPPLLDGAVGTFLRRLAADPGPADSEPAGRRTSTIEKVG